MRAPALGGEMDFRTDTYQIRQQAPNLAIFWGPVVEALPGKLCMLFDGAEFAFGITFEFSDSKTCYFRLI